MHITILFFCFFFVAKKGLTVHLIPNTKRKKTDSEKRDTVLLNLFFAFYDIFPLIFIVLLWFLFINFPFPFHSPCQENTKEWCQILWVLSNFFLLYFVFICSYRSSVGCPAFCCFSYFPSNSKLAECLKITKLQYWFGYLI
jgi:hypothetical protein